MHVRRRSRRTCLVTLDHLLREPDGEAEGALVLNHGRGTDERDLQPLLDQFDPDRRLLGVTPGAPLDATDVAALSPFPVAPGGRHWYAIQRVGHPEPQSFDRAYRALAGFLDELLERRGIDWSRAIVGGFSMGAVMSYAVALGPGRPRPAGILALSGFVPTVEGWEPDFGARAGLPALIHHGRADPVIGVDFGRAAARLLGDGGLDVDYVESDAGHWVPPELVPRVRAFVAAALPSPGRAQA
jgi:phospholipase/carboxylesterase